VLWQHVFQAVVCVLSAVQRGKKEFWRYQKAPYDNKNYNIKTDNCSFEKWNEFN
jgi:hypothetical protein